MDKSFFYSLETNDLRKERLLHFPSCPTTFISLVQRPDDAWHHSIDETKWILCIFPLWEKEHVWNKKQQGLLWLCFTKTWITKIDLGLFVLRHYLMLGIGKRSKCRTRFGTAASTNLEAVQSLNAVEASGHCGQKKKKIHITSQTRTFIKSH